MVASPVETGIGIAIILTGVPVYFIFVYSGSRKPKFIQKFSAAATFGLQKLFVVISKEQQWIIEKNVVVKENIKICVEFSIWNEKP